MSLLFKKVGHDSGIVTVVVVVVGATGYGKI